MKAKELPVFMNILSLLNILSGLRLLMILTDNLRTRPGSPHIMAYVSLLVWLRLLAHLPLGSHKQAYGYENEYIAGAIAAAGGPPLRHKCSN